MKINFKKQLNDIVKKNNIRNPDNDKSTFSVGLPAWDEEEDIFG